ncbi:sugar O-acetyltransferase [Vagococcus fluvialis]|uniref:sugar O-acetyltransferase n=1 Tax=Vagococcus fluvialis TaxID=2738 RepID=UPI003B5B94F4
MRTEKERMIAGDLYSSIDNQELKDGMLKARIILHEFNYSHPTEEEKRQRLIRELFGKTSELFLVEQPFKCDHGFNISVGEGFFANFDCIMLDGAPITIGDRVCLGPRVGLYTADHPLDKDVRSSCVEFSSPITIGDDVWLGAGVIVMPGVSIGSNVIVGAGSIVTKDIPDNVIAVGNPCKVLRMLTHKDKEYWDTLLADYRAELEQI